MKSPINIVERRRGEKERRWKGRNKADCIQKKMEGYDLRVPFISVIQKH